MDRAKAEELANLVREECPHSEQFRIEDERQTPLEGFHSWADGKDCVGAFLIQRVRDDVGYWFLFIDHRENDNFYLSIVEKGQYVLELHKCENENSREFMTWKYGPTKRDGNNDKRKSQFEKLAGSLEQKILLPGENLTLDDFIEDIFLLARNRLTADDLTIPLSGRVPGDRSAPKKDDMQRSLNTILYGPPGTGKTYATTRHYVEICDGQAARLDEEVRNRYRELVQTGRVEFITFHQSYGYEEFVEGLRPETGSGSPTKGKEEAREENGVGFRLVASDGVVKCIAKRARSREVKTVPIDLSGRKVFKMRLGNPNESSEHDDIFRKCIEDSCALLGSFGRGEVNLSDPRFEYADEMFGCLRGIDPRMTKRKGMYQSLRYFRCEMKATDLIIVPDRSGKFRAIGEITGEYEFVQGNKHVYCHRRKVHWHWWDYHAKPIAELYRGTLTRGTIGPLRLNEIRWDGVHRYMGHATESEREPYVLIIDEVNRANVSKVLGELVTLLEEDKREGAENEVAVTLPHSRDRFTLPSNLHIVGTMNTADRSIALLDTALRRRFEFEELAPDPDALQDAKKATGIDLPEVLRAMNGRLEWLIDRDHLIGHAWLMKARTRDDVDQVMRRKIIPLIAEYFYDDWEKVHAVLGGTGDFVQGQPLDPPPGLDDTAENRQRWTVRDEFNEGAYDRLVKGPSASSADTGDTE